MRGAVLQLTVIDVSPRGYSGGVHAQLLLQPCQDHRNYFGSCREHAGALGEATLIGPVTT